MLPFLLSPKYNFVNNDRYLGSRISQKTLATSFAKDAKQTFNNSYVLIIHFIFNLY